jgi:hypothetical protein
VVALVEYLKHPSDFQPLLLSELIVLFHLPCEFSAGSMNLTICILVADGGPFKPLLGSCRAPLYRCLTLGGFSSTFMGIT